MANTLTANTLTNKIDVAVGGIQDHEKLTNIGTQTHLQLEARLNAIESGPIYIDDLTDLAQFLVAGTYELTTNKYIFRASINFGTANIKLVSASGGYSFEGLSVDFFISYTGTAAFITTNQTDIIMESQSFFFNTPNATTVSMTNGNSFISTLVVFFAAPLACSLTTFGFLTLNDLPVIGCDDGFIATDVGTITCKLPQFNSGSNVSGKFLTCSGAASERLIVSTIDSRPESTESMFQIEANWAGLANFTGGVHRRAGGEFFSATSRDHTDNDVIVNSIDNVTPSRATASVFIASGSEVSTPITDTNQTLILGTYTQGLTQNFVTANSRLTYKGNAVVIFPFIFKCLATPASGNNRDYDFFIRHTKFIGTVVTLIPISFHELNIDAGTPQTALCIGDISMATDDFIEPVVIGQNSGANIAITCSALSFITG